MDNLEVKINKHGGARAGAGRKRKEGCEGIRERKTMRAYDDEWNIINRFGALVKKGHKEKCLKFVESLELIGESPLNKQSII